jgi:hypothetical protein
MAYKIPQQIAWLSKYVQLRPGDVIATGTYHEGLGPFNDGDLLEIEIDRLGKCSFNVKGYGPQNPVAGEKATTPRSDKCETLCHPEFFKSRGPLLESDVHILMFSLSEIRKNRTAAARIIIT